MTGGAFIGLGLLMLSSSVFANKNVEIPLRTGLMDGVFVYKLLQLRLSWITLKVE